jgi:ABC-2 type transport system permease protein
MRALRLVYRFAAVSGQAELAYRTNFWISLLHALLNLGTGLLGLMVLFDQVEGINGWDLPATLALLGVYLTLSALRALFFGPSLEALAGMDGEVWTGKFDFTLLRPLDVQFQASFRHWRPLALIDLGLSLGVLIIACLQMDQGPSLSELACFALALASGLTVLYAILLTFAGLVFWSPGFLFTWLFDGLFQMARYPVGMYPGWLRMALTWVLPVGVMTTMPAQALAGRLSPGALAGGLALAVGTLVLGTTVFRVGLRRYVSASS